METQTFITLGLGKSIINYHLVETDAIKALDYEDTISVYDEEFDRRMLLIPENLFQRQVDRYKKNFFNWNSCAITDEMETWIIRQFNERIRKPQSIIKETTSLIRRKTA